MTRSNLLYRHLKVQPKVGKQSLDAWVLLITWFLLDGSDSDTSHLLDVVALHEYLLGLVLEVPPASPASMYASSNCLPEGSFLFVTAA